MFRSRNHRQETPAGEYAMHLPLSGADSEPCATKQTSIFHGNAALLHPRRSLTLGHCVRFDAPAHAEAYCDSNRTAQIGQNRLSYPHLTAHSVALGAAWSGAAAPLFRNRIVARAFPI